MKNIFSDKIVNSFLSQETIQEILGIKERVYIHPEEMADNMNITFFPLSRKNISK